MQILEKSSCVQNVGKLFSHSKRKIVWNLQVQNVDHCVELVYSRYSSKFRLFVNGTKVIDQVYYGKYQSQLVFEVAGVPGFVQPTGAGCYNLCFKGFGTFKMPNDRPATQSSRVCPSNIS